MSRSSRLDDCGCCEGLHVETPMEIFNRPGLSAIAYRGGTHAKFRKSMLARLSGPDLSALSEITARSNVDFSIALLDAWAIVADVLTFYQERIANESYLRTATERFSLLQLARLIGFELRPGVAASAALAFTLDDAPGAPGLATIDVGVKVLSVPGQNQKPQTFETVEKIEARAEWNAMKLRLTQQHPVGANLSTVYFAGISTGIRAGDGVLLTPGNGGSVFRLVADVTIEAESSRTKVNLQMPPSSIPLSPSDAGGLAETPALPSVTVFRVKASIFGHNAPLLESLPISQRVGEKNPNGQGTPPFLPGVFAGRVSDVKADSAHSWAETTLDRYHRSGGDPPVNAIDLDGTYPGIVKDSDTKSSIVLLRRDDDTFKVFKVADRTDLTKADFALTAKITRLFLRTTGSLSPLDDLKLFPKALESFPIRRTAVFAQNEDLPLAGVPLDDVLPAGSTLQLDGLIDKLAKGQTLIVCGELADEKKRGTSTCEPVVIGDVNHNTAQAFTQITLARGLASAYLRNTVRIYGNVALASHGETVEEVLGSGDSSQPHQRLVLRQPPLTYVSAPSASGAKSTLRVRVNDVLWHEVPALFGQGPRDRVYVTRIEDDGTTTVQFGDGKTGARLPSGQENVRALYRKGIGVDGLVSAGQLTALITRPAGVRSVTNPTDASGAQGRQSIGDARRGGPLTVLTLDRIVSLQDYEDFTRAFAGIAKALGTRTWTGQASGVFLTVASENGGRVERGTALYENLLAAIQAAGDPHAAVRVASYRPALFQIAGRINVDPDFEAEKVLNAVRESLRTSFSFEARAFGQPVALGEVMALIQSTAGVVAVDIDTLRRTDRVGGDGIKNPLPSAMPQLGEAGDMLAAELLMIETNSLLDLNLAP